MTSLRRSRGRIAGFHAIPAVVLLLLAGCTGDDAPPEDPPPAPIIATATVPPSAGIAITAEQLSKSDPCGLLDPQSLSKFGDAKIEADSRFTHCSGEISVPQGDLVRISLGFDFDLSRDSMTPMDQHGVTVYRDNGDPNWCLRDIVVSAATVINLGVASETEPNRCRVADAVIDAMVPKLKQGHLRPANYPPNSLANQDACRLLQHGETNRLPGIDRTEVHPTYGGQACTWGVEFVSEPNVFLELSRSFPREVTGSHERSTTISGRPAVVSPFSGGENEQYRTLPDCDVDFVHRPLDQPSGVRTVELVHLSVSFDGPEETRCDLAIELATKVADRLPEP